MKLYTLAWSIPNDKNGILVREFLKEKQISKAALTDIKFRGGFIMVNNEPVTVRHILKEQDILEIGFPKEIPSEDMKAENIPLSIVYEDEVLLVINKPAGMSTIPSREHPTGSLANALLYYYKLNDIASTIHIVNRLDRDTSGLLLVAKHRYIHHLMSSQQKNGDIRRRYEALVHGTMKLDQGVVDAPIGRASHSIIEREVRSDGQRAVTHFNVLQRSIGFSHVSLNLETGRTHQIRVHMAYLGHPLLGDTLYGGERTILERQALHSCELSFFHPTRHVWMKHRVDLPADMKKLVEDK
ncbi:RluA family pseudouridine synthase [Bacillus salitolerans]|uniref:Pseudouridine synthase n=1 Tax=Bacillus salitolerans TaxID=1437434 RepID=A0ABW4LMQ5_9BACI